MKLRATGRLGPGLALAVVAGAVVTVLAMAPAGAPDWAPYRGTFHRTLAVNGPVEMHIATGSGSIRVSRGAASEVTIDAVIQGRDEDQVQAIERNPPVEQEGNLIDIGHLSEELGRNVAISYVITTPAATTLRAGTGSGHVEISGLTGDVRLSTGSGEISATQLGGDLTASTGSGAVAVGQVEGMTQLSTGSGSIEAQSVGGGLHASTGSGHIGIQDPRGEVDASTGSGHITITGVQGSLRAVTGSGGIDAQGSLSASSRWDLESGSGGVALHIPSTTRAEIDAHSGSGSITSSLPLTVEGRLNRHEVHGFLNEAAGGNGAQIVVRASSGSVVID